MARRVVADRCLYGVDINPMAVEMAKLSLWLITVMQDRPFTFLDHAFKCGDSLLGISSIDQLENFSLRPNDAGKQHTFATMNLRQRVQEAKGKRETLETMPSDTPEQIAAKVALYAEAEEATAKVKALADYLMAFELRGLDGDAYQQARTAVADRAEVAMRKSLPEFQAYAHKELAKRNSFHWPVKFPEVFARAGFDAFVGNPPFRGGLMITRDFGLDYTLYLKSITTNAGTTTDLCAYSFVAHSTCYAAKA